MATHKSLKGPKQPVGEVQKPVREMDDGSLDAEIKLSVKRSDEKKKRKTEVKFSLRLGFIEHIKKLFINPKLWWTAGGIATLGAAVGGGALIERSMNYQEDWLANNCSLSFPIEERSKKIGNLNIEVERRDSALIVRLGDGKNVDVVALSKKLLVQTAVLGDNLYVVGLCENNEEGIAIRKVNKAEGL